MFVKGYKSGVPWFINILPYEIQNDREQLPPEKVYPLELYTGGATGNIGIDTNSFNMGVT